MSDRLEPVLARIDAGMDDSLERLKDLLRIPSISTDPKYAGDVKRAAEWCATELSAIGFDASARETSGHPMVVAHHAADRPGAPRILYYGHYDVQPPDPLELWDSPPFEPAIVEAEHGPRIVARGAVDDKGQLLTFVEAFRAWKAEHGSLPVHVTVILEGEEECGSPSLEPFLEAQKDELAAEVCIISDTAMWDVETPAVTTMLRGMVYVQVTLHGPSHDLHSGIYGGGVINPLNALTRVLGELQDEQGRCRVPGFYDDVRAVSAEQAAAWKGLGFDEAAFVRGAGLEQSTGEQGHDLLTRLWARPTCDLNGVWGGYIGEGAKTVIPAHASAKLSCRLVPDQDPEKVYAGIVQFFEERTPPGCRFEFQRFGCDPAIRVAEDSPHLESARRALARVFDNKPVLIGCGGSIPVVGSIQRILGFDSLLVGFGLEDDRLHSPNEKFEVRCFHRGVRSHAALLEELGKGD